MVQFCCISLRVLSVGEEFFQKINFFDPFGLSEINLLNPNDQYYKYDKNINTPGKFTITGHGTSTFLYGPNGEIYYAAEVAEMIKKHKDFKGQDIQVNSCYGGKDLGEYSNFADQLSLLLNVSVTASTGVVVPQPNGAIALDGDAKWTTYPKKK